MGCRRLRGLATAARPGIVIACHGKLTGFSLAASVVLTLCTVTNAQISFAPPVRYGAAATTLVAADLDGDGDIDLATDDSGGGHVSVLLNNGDATFAAPVLNVVPANVRALASGDMDGDGDVDLLLARAGVLTGSDSIISVMPNQGNGTFDAAIDYPVIVSGVPNQSLTPMALAVADLDGDGDLDIAAATTMLSTPQQDGFISVIPNTGLDGLGQPTFGPSVNIDTTESFTTNIVAGDFDNDTDIDLAATNAVNTATNSVSIVLNDGTGTFGAVDNVSLSGPIALARNIAAGDVNGDNFVDLVTINGFHSFSVVLNLNGGVDPASAGVFSDQGQFPLGSDVPATANIPAGGALGDFDGDGDLDLVAGLLGSAGPFGDIVFLANIGGVTFFGPEMSFDFGENYAVPIAVDLDNDGDLDVAAVNLFMQSVTILVNQLLSPPPMVTQWQSCGDHGMVVGEACLTIPDDGSFAEPRLCADRLVISFNMAVDPATATPSNVAIFGNDVFNQPVDLSGVAVTVTTRAADTEMVITTTPPLPDVARYRVALANITGATGAPFVGDVDRIFTEISGDANQSRHVTNGDLGFARFFRDQPTNPVDPTQSGEVIADVNCSGSVTNADLAAIRFFRDSGSDARAIADP